MNVHDSSASPACSRPPATSTSRACPRRPPRGRRRRRLQHLRRPRERRQQALRQPRPPATQDSQPRTSRSPSAAACAEGPRDDRRAPWSTWSSAPTSAYLRPARPCTTSGRVEILESLETFPSTLPTRRDSAFAGWVSISVGCNSTCTFCIVPSLRGTEQDRRPGEVLAGSRPSSRRASSRSPCSARTSTPTASSSATGSRSEGAGPAARSRAWKGAPTSPPAAHHDVIAAMAETPNVMPSLHMPLQSGSDRAEGDAAVLPRPRGSSASSTRSAVSRRRDHRRPRRQVPRRDRERTSPRPAGRRGLALLQRLHPVLDQGRHARGDARPGAQGRRAGALRAARRAAGARLVGREPHGRGSWSRCSSRR